MGFVFSIGAHGFKESPLRRKLLKHFGVPAFEIATAQFPITARVDIQSAPPLSEFSRRTPMNLTSLALARDQGLPFAVIMALGGRFGLRSGVQVEIAVSLWQSLGVRESRAWTG